MSQSLYKAFIVLLSVALSFSCVSVSARQEKTQYPNQLLGVWQGDSTTCRLPGNLDSDTRMEIKPDKLVDFEQWSEPLIVLQISKQPQAWRIKSRLHIDEHSYDQYEIYVLSGSDKGSLTVIDQNRSTTYVRC
ncbi:MAG TPA: hypothetical protein VET30_02510, partial [Pseudoxanthomonas sp.]|nr:hypothetical protein [Pseudoxanthomonas sp.]